MADLPAITRQRFLVMKRIFEIGATPTEDLYARRKNRRGIQQSDIAADDSKSRWRSQSGGDVRGTGSILDVNVSVVRLDGSVSLAKVRA